MKQPLDILRLLAELVATVALAEAIIFWGLPIIAPGVGGAMEAVLNFAVLSVLAVPVMLWRVRCATRRAGVNPDKDAAVKSPLVLANAAIVFLLAFAATAAVVTSLNREVEREARARFEQLSERLVGETQRRVMQPRYGMAGARGVYAATKSGERSEFEAYVASRDLSKEFPGALGFGFIQRVMRSDLDAFIAAERADGAPELTVSNVPGVPVEGEPAPDLWVIKHCFPKERNAPAWGLDIGSEPIRREAAERAARTGEPSITGRISLVQGGKGQTGFLYFLPVYKKGTKPTTPDERMSALTGLIYAPMILEEALVGVEESVNGFLDFEIFHGEQLGSSSQLFDLDNHLAATAKEITAADYEGRLFQKVTQVSIGGQTWTFWTSTTPAFHATIDRTIPVITAVSGALLSLLLAGIVWMLGNGRGRAIRLAERMTADLSAAKASAERLAEIARRTSNGVIISDVNGRIEWVNEGFTRITGYTLEEVKGRKPGHVLQGPDTDKLEAARIARAVAAGLPVTAELVNYSKDGKAYTIAIELCPLRNEAGELNGFMAIESDITDQKAAAEVLRVERERLDIAAASARMGLWDWMPQTGYVRFDERWAEMIGYRLDELKPHVSEWADRVHPDDLPAAMKAAQEAMRSGTPYSSEHRMRHRDGSWRWILDQGRVISRDAQGEVTRFVGSHLDITERVESQRCLGESMRAAEAANRAKSAFLANMSHEIRTPLTAILGFTDLLREDGDLTAAPERRLQAIDTIKNAGEHLLTVINDILDLSKIEADKMTVERIETPLVGVLHEVESLMRPRALGKGLSLKVNLTTPLPERITSDPTRLRQILLNLVGNAVKFTEEGGVTISAAIAESDGAHKLVIDVEDTGPGMTSEHAARLFQAFGQADETTSRKFGGTGLGLTICRRLALMMGGEANLLRTQPDKGSCFRLTLPLDTVPGSAMISHWEAVAERSAQAPTDAVKTLRGRILLTEDGLDNQRLIAFHLRRAGATVEIADNGVIALEKLEKAQAQGTPFDLLLTDIQMPEMDGYTLARTLRERGNKTPIVALTAHAMAEHHNACIEAGCDDYATKPIDKALLLAVCEKWLDKGAQGRGLRSAA
jgi:PAS domain S-box-containing protein